MTQNCSLISFYPADKPGPTGTTVGLITDHSKGTFSTYPVSVGGVSWVTVNPSDPEPKSFPRGVQVRSMDLILKGSTSSTKLVIRLRDVSHCE